MQIQAELKSELTNRKAFSITPGQANTINAPRRQYVYDFVRSQGYDPKNLDDSRLVEVFKLLARVEEFATNLKYNNHNWEMNFASIKRQKECLEPVVDIMLRQWAKEGILPPIPSALPFWPEGKRFALCLTHDVDIIRSNLLKERIRSLPATWSAPLRHQVNVGLSLIKETLLSLAIWQPKREPSLLDWLEEEKKHGFRSTFFFIAEPLPYPHWEDAFYDYKDQIDFNGTLKELGMVMRVLAKMGWEIGLHGASRSSFSPDLLEREKQIVEKAVDCQVSSIRQHHLTYDIRYSPYFQARAGFKTDSTLGSNVNICFRCGTCFPFFMYDLYSEKTLDLLQVPLIIQDIAIFRQMGLNNLIAMEQCLEVMQQVAQVNGVMTLLWHNHWQQDSTEFSVYRQLIGEAEKMGAWGCSVRDINEWWRGRMHQQKFDSTAIPT